MTLFRTICFALVGSALSGPIAAVVSDYAKSQEFGKLEMQNNLVPGAGAISPKVPPPPGGPPDTGPESTARPPSDPLFPVTTLERSNPLWDIPRASLLDTRERPPFSPSRRLPAHPVSSVSLPAGDPDGPLLTLVGTIANPDEAIAIFVEKSSKRVIRLKIGENYLGWSLSAVRSREVTLVHNHKAEILYIPVP
jgi:general secretion pathway protein N